MRLLASLAAVAITAATLLGVEPRAQAQAFLPEQPAAPSVFVYHGQRYCFAPDGWNGPGWYWCGYARRPGVGWGGPVGWRGWNPRWGHGPVVFPGHGGWHPHGRHGGGWHPHDGPHGGAPHGRHPRRHGGSHPGHGHDRHPHHHHHGGHRHRR